MHPILAERRVLAAYLAIWLAPASLLASVLAGGRWSSAAPAVAVAYPIAFVYAFICLSAWYVCQWAPLRTTRVPRVLAHTLGAATASSVLWLLIARAFAAAIDSTAPGAGAAFLVARETPLLVASAFLAYLLAAAVAYAMTSWRDAREAERRALELQVLAREAELRALRAQVDPHFLFNSLNSISGLIGSDPAGARRMCVLLGDFLRTSMRLGAQDRVTLAEELALAVRFLDIERVRFGDRLGVESTVGGICVGVRRAAAAPAAAGRERRQARHRRTGRRRADSSRRAPLGRPPPRSPSRTLATRSPARGREPAWGSTTCASAC